MVAPWAPASRRSAVESGVGRDLAGGEVGVDRTTPSCSPPSPAASIALQAPINSHLGRAVGTFQAALAVVR